MWFFQHFSVPITPQSVVALRPDTIGDLVIFSSALEVLRKAWPSARITVVVRRGYEALEPLLAAGIEWRVAAFNPFGQKPSECRRELTDLLKELESLEPDLILAPTLRRTWLEAAVAARFPKVRSVALGGHAVDPLFAAALRIELGVDAAAVFHEIVEADGAARDWDNQNRLVDHLLGVKAALQAPRISVPAEAAARADAILADFGWARNRWAAVFAGGLANVPIKAWRPEAFGELAAWIEEKRGMPVLFMGHESERTAIEEAREAARRAGRRTPAAWLGRDGELPLLAALLERSALYVGHDTGAMHVAAALGRPTVGIFGGGHWPRFRPVGRQVLSIVQPLPCFGCDWDCHFGDGPCVKTIAVEDVSGAVEQALSRGERPFDEVLETKRLSEQTRRLIAAATPRYAALQADRLDRQHRIEDLKAETNAKDREIADLKAAAEERKAESDEKDAEIVDLKRIAEERKAESEAKDVEIADLKKETDAKDVEIADLKRAAEERKAESDAKDREISDLKRTCNEREALIFQQHDHIKNFQKIVAGMTSAQADRDSRLAAAERERERVAAILAKLPPDAEDWSEKFSAKDVHIRNIEAALAAREQEVSALRRSLENHAAGYHNLEQAKRFDRILAEKEGVIQNLNQACVEREALIRKLAADATGPTAGLNKLWLAAGSHVRMKWTGPLGRWFFKKAVEDYWMQIGVLRHYDPRPISWDRRLPKRHRLPESRLPKLGIVTPSFGQPAYIESTMLSILNQGYPKLLYVVQDGGSPEQVRAIIAKHGDRLRHWESAPDRGQADAVRIGFSKIEAELGPDDLMAWLNSDDFAAPRALRYVAEYFAEHPDVDVVYGHRIIIDEQDREIGRWIMPRHDPADLEWIDYVPQETLYWRKRAWDLAGGIDPAFQFALDWDLLARFQRAKCKIVRLPYFLGCFRVHPEQKTSQVIHTTGADEMARIRVRFHPGRENDFDCINRHARRIRFRGAIVARLLGAGVRW